MNVTRPVLLRSTVDRLKFVVLIFAHLCSCRMKICCSRRAKSVTKGISKFFSADMVNTRIDLKRVENLFTDSKDNINSISPGGVKLPRQCPSEKWFHTQKYQIGKKRIPPLPVRNLRHRVAFLPSHGMGFLIYLQELS